MPSKKVSQIILKIILLQTEYSKKEIQEAIKILSAYGGQSMLVEYLNTMVHKDKKEERKSGQPKITYNANVLQKIRDKEPEKYKILIELDALIRNGSILPNLQDIKSIALRFSKSFPKVKTKKESIPKFIELLSTQPLDDVKILLKDLIKEDGLADKSSEYYRLAQYLIHGET